MDTENQVKKVDVLSELSGYAPRPLFELTKRDNVFAVFAVLVSIALSLFGLFGGFALGYLITATLTIVLYTVYFAKGGKSSVWSVLCGLLALGTNAVFLCTSNSSVRLCGIFVGILLSLACYDGLVGGKVKGNRSTLGIFYSAFSTFANMGAAIKSFFSGVKGDKKALSKVLIGLLCAVPVLFVVVPLLLASDDAFRGMMTNVFNNTFTILIESIIGLIICPFVITYGISLKAGRVSKIKESSFKGIESAYLVSFLSAIGVCYLLYLFSQFAYFFSAFSGFLPNGEITYAEYARKGFFEMCVIAVINLAIVFFSLILAKKKEGKVSHGIKALTTFISAFTLVIIATAISKMVLYISAYGMTVLRLTTSAFMVFLGIVFIGVILRIYVAKINVVKTVLVAAGSIVVILGTLNVNAVCAWYNYDSYKDGRLSQIDVQGLYDLGYEGIPYLTALALSEPPPVSTHAKSYLEKALETDYFTTMPYGTQRTVENLKKYEKDRGFEFFSIPKARAYESLYTYVELVNER